MDNSIKQQVSHRLAIAEGHLKKVREMVDEEVYCLDIIHQSRAVQAALKKVDEVILHGHLHSCVLKDMHGEGNENEKMVKEIVDLFNKTD
jgi:DNA-binding FrmR family transcriptional regulator